MLSLGDVNLNPANRRDAYGEIRPPSDPAASCSGLSSETDPEPVRGGVHRPRRGGNGAARSDHGSHHTTKFTGQSPFAALPAGPQGVAAQPHEGGQEERPSIAAHCQ